MSKTYHTKKVFRQKMDKIDKSREEQSSESGVTVLSTLNQYYNGYIKAKKNHTRHPSGSKATGLKQWIKGKRRVTDMRDRFGEAEEQSSRLRREHRAESHSARLKIKNELRTMMNDLENEVTPCNE